MSETRERRFKKALELYTPVSSKALNKVKYIAQLPNKPQNYAHQWETLRRNMGGALPG